MEYKINSRTKRLARFCDFYPHAMLDLIAMGEPLTIELLKEIEANNHDLIDEIFKLDFSIKYEFDPYAIGPMVTDHAQSIFDFMKNYYGKELSETLVLEREALWANFLPFVTKALYEDGRIVNLFKDLVAAKQFEKACKLLEKSSKKYRFKIQKCISDKQLLNLFEYAESNLSIDASDVFDVCYLTDKNMISVSVVNAFLNMHEDEDKRKAVKKILRRKGGLEVLKKLKNNYITDLMRDLGAI